MCSRKEMRRLHWLQRALQGGEEGRSVEAWPEGREGTGEWCEEEGLPFTRGWVVEEVLISFVLALRCVAEKRGGVYTATPTLQSRAAWRLPAIPSLACARPHLWRGLSEPA